MGVMIKDSALMDRGPDHMICTDSPGAFCQITWYNRKKALASATIALLGGSNPGREAHSWPELLILPAVHPRMPNNGGDLDIERQPPAIDAKNRTVPSPRHSTLGR